MTPSEELKLLIVDDESIVRETLGAFVSHLGYDVAFAEDGLMATRMIEQHCFSGAFIDIRMPRMDGIELLHWIQRHRSHLPVIIMTGHGNEQIGQEVIQAGAIGFLQKPFQFSEITTMISKIKQLTSCGLD